jgi:NAD(P)-dependent dehydrogenase (short-subunit alcohol dehydrogenase family)
VRIIVVGATGTIGSAIVEALGGRHEVVRVGHSRGEHRVDIESEDSVRRFFGEVGRFDALVSAAGRAAFKPMEQLAAEDFLFGMNSKFLGQVNLVRHGLAQVADGGSFTLTSGVLAREPMPGGTAISPVNAAVEAFALSAAKELPRGIRVNVVSPPWVSETLKAMGQDGAGGLPASVVARAYAEAAEGTRSGETLDARDFA